MRKPVAVVVKADHLPVRVNAERSRRRERTREVNLAETASAQQEAVAVPGGISVLTDDLPPIVDSLRLRASDSRGPSRTSPVYQNLSGLTCTTS